MEEDDYSQDNKRPIDDTYAATKGCGIAFLWSLLFWIPLILVIIYYWR